MDSAICQLLFVNSPTSSRMHKSSEGLLPVLSNPLFCNFHEVSITFDIVFDISGSGVCSCKLNIVVDNHNVVMLSEMSRQNDDGRAISIQILHAFYTQWGSN